MLVGVVSDTHDRVPMIDAALELFARRGVEAAIHAGDIVAPFAARRLLRYSGPWYVIYGNNDGERQGLASLFPQITEGPLLVRLGGRLLLVQHSLDECDLAGVGEADVIITGHTHTAENRLEGSRLFLNPGECCGWVTGRATVAMLDTEGMSAEICELESSP